MNFQVSPHDRNRRLYSKKVSPTVPVGSYNIAEVTYELNFLGKRRPRRIHCTMHSIPTSVLEPDGHVTGQPELLPRSLDDTFRSISFSKSLDNSSEFGSSCFSDIAGLQDKEVKRKEEPLILMNKAPRSHKLLWTWCLIFCGRVTVASVNNFQLLDAAQPAAAGAPTPSQPSQSDHDQIILQFGKVGDDMFTMTGSN